MMMTTRTLALLSLLLPILAGCGGGPTIPGDTRDLPDTDVRVLFVGNSLTYSNDLPGLVATLAGALGIEVGSVTAAGPNLALEDHWYMGIAGIIREVRPDFVVMQQGPSSLPENRAHLVAWSDTLARVIREVDAQPALLMVWPSLARYDFFDDVRDSYRAAAEGVDGTFIPAGEALRAVYESHPEMAVFGPDGFHPSREGSLLAALVTVGTLFEREVAGLPAAISPPPTGGAAVSVPEEVAITLQAVADSVSAAWRPGSPP